MAQRQKRKFSKRDNASTLLNYVNDNYKDAKLSESAANTLYSTLEDGKVDLNQLNPETLNKNLFGYNYPDGKNPRNIMANLIIQ
ncbi:hypothetical protein [Chryseobacterium carnipullorum]|uniref:hypothetical protein n=1 Tax=Chryseobacterium carnipullorum TaxID=1124835 RepID=UPI0015F1601A|nr:hypothetical protein [Chryseobacterium carnipullorum]